MSESASELRTQYSHQPWPAMPSAAPWLSSARVQAAIIRLRTSKERGTDASRTHTTAAARGQRSTQRQRDRCSARRAFGMAAATILAGTFWILTMQPLMKKDECCSPLLMAASTAARPEDQ